MGSEVVQQSVSIVENFFNLEYNQKFIGNKKSRRIPNKKCQQQAVAKHFDIPK